MKFYKRDPHRAMIGMAELTLRQRGAYNSLLDLLYAQDGDVPDDDQRVARMISCHWREWKAVKAELMALGKVWVDGGKLCAKKVQETLNEASDFAQKQGKRAAKGWQERKSPNENNDGVMPRGNAITPTPTATPTAIEDRGKPPISPAPVIEPTPEPRGVGALRLVAIENRAKASRWPEFRAAYPKREGGQGWPVAEKKYVALVASGIPEEVLIDGARRYAEHLKATGKIGTQYVKQAQTWVNQEGWKDEYLNGTGRRGQSDLMDAFDDRRREAEAYAGDRAYREGDGPAWDIDATALPG